MFKEAWSYAGRTKGPVANTVLKDMAKGIVQTENTAQIYTLGFYWNPTEKQQRGSSWTGAHEEFQAGESDAEA